MRNQLSPKLVFVQIKLVAMYLIGTVVLLIGISSNETATHTANVKSTLKLVTSELVILGGLVTLLTVVSNSSANENFGVNPEDEWGKYTDMKITG